MDRPIILNPKSRKDLRYIRNLVKNGVQSHDFVDRQIQELSKIKPTPNFDDTLDSVQWVYYPWHQKIIKIVGEKYFYLLRTSRNNPLYTRSDQQKMSRLTIGVAGLSVGSNIVRSLVYAGIGNVIKIADPDTLETTNLNRISSNLLDLGQNKTENMARQIWELNPYQIIETYPLGLTGYNLQEFLQQPKLDVLFDEVDDLSLKIHLKLAARAAKIIYMMVTDNGYQAELDVARFDEGEAEGGMEQVPSLTIGEVIDGLKISEKISLSAKEEQSLINSMIGSDSRAPEMKLASDLKLKGKISGWPQLQSVATVGASLATLAIHKLVTNQLKSGKKVISLI